MIQGDPEPLPRICLGGSNTAWLDFPGEANQKLDGSFVYITQPEGDDTKGIWEMIPEDAPDTLYRVTLEANDSVTMACFEGREILWEYLLEPTPIMGFTIKDVLGTINGSADWYVVGELDGEEITGGLPLRGRGTISLSVPGDEATVTVFEEFHDGDQVECQTLTLTRNDRGKVEFERKVRESVQTQFAIYRIPYDEGEFVLVLNFIP